MHIVINDGRRIPQRSKIMVAELSIPRYLQYEQVFLETRNIENITVTLLGSRVKSQLYSTHSNTKKAYQNYNHYDNKILTN